MPEALILSAVRTPIGKYLGALADVSAPQLEDWFDLCVSPKQAARKAMQLGNKAKTGEKPLCN